MEFRTTENFITTISELAKEANGNEVDFGLIPVDEDRVYNIITLSVVAELKDKPVEVLLASIVAMNVQQFVTEFQRLSKDEELQDFQR